MCPTTLMWGNDDCFFPALAPQEPPRASSSHLSTITAHRSPNLCSQLHNLFLKLHNITWACVYMASSPLPRVSQRQSTAPAHQTDRASIQDMHRYLTFIPHGCRVVSVDLSRLPTLDVASTVLPGPAEVTRSLLPWRVWIAKWQ